MDYKELEKAYEAIAILRELNIPVSAEQTHKIAYLERQYMKEEIIPLMKQELEPFLGRFRNDVAFLVSYSKEEGLQMAFPEDKPTASFHKEKMDRKHKQDRTKYSIDGGMPFPKNRFVWEVVKRYVDAHPSVTLSELQQQFPDSLSGSVINGVVRTYDSVKVRGERQPDILNRFWTKPEDLITLGDGTKIVVYNQWGRNFEHFLAVARELHDVRAEK